MDTKLLEGDTYGTSLGIEALISIASRQKRKEFFYRSLLRSALLTLLFIAFGCFLTICNEEKSAALRFMQESSPFDVRGMLKELFMLSLIPSVGFALCFSLGGRLCRLCDTVFPAVYGTVCGMFLYVKISPLTASFSVTQMIKLSPYLFFVFSVLTVYTLFCPVCASFGECRRKGTLDGSDPGSCFTYFLTSLTALALSVVLRDTALIFI